VIINGNKFFYVRGLKLGAGSPNFRIDNDHLHLFRNSNDNFDKEILENKWNHVEVYFGPRFRYSGIHVLKEKSSMEDIQFTNPEIE
jgi:hypothetical protein